MACQQHRIQRHQRSKRQKKNQFTRNSGCGGNNNSGSKWSHHVHGHRHNGHLHHRHYQQQPPQNQQPQHQHPQHQHPQHQQPQQQQVHRQQPQPQHFRGVPRGVDPCDASLGHYTPPPRLRKEPQRAHRFGGNSKAPKAAASNAMAAAPQRPGGAVNGGSGSRPQCESEGGVFVHNDHRKQQHFYQRKAVPPSDEELEAQIASIEQLESAEAATTSSPSAAAAGAELVGAAESVSSGIERMELMSWSGTNSGDALSDGDILRSDSGASSASAKKEKSPALSAYAVSFSPDPAPSSLSSEALPALHGAHQHRHGGLVRAAGLHPLSFPQPVDQNVNRWTVPLPLPVPAVAAAPKHGECFEMAPNSLSSLDLDSLSPLHGHCGHNPYPPPPLHLGQSVDGECFVAIDVECAATGHGHFDSAPCRIAMVDFFGTVLFDQIAAVPLLQDPLTEFTGLSAEDIANAPPLEQVLHHFHSELAALNRMHRFGVTIVGQSLIMDLIWTALKEGVHYSRTIDIAQLFATKHERWSKATYYSLRQAAWGLLGAEMNGDYHDPTEDARVTMALYRECCLDHHVLAKCKERLHCLKGERLFPDFSVTTHWEQCSGMYSPGRCRCGQSVAVNVRSVRDIERLRALYDRHRGRPLLDGLSAGPWRRATASGPAATPRPHRALSAKHGVGAAFHGDDALRHRH